MFFENVKEARAYAKSQTADLRGKLHKAVRCNQWRFDRISGEYALFPCFTVILA